MLSSGGRPNESKRACFVAEVERVVAAVHLRMLPRHDQWSHFLKKQEALRCCMRVLHDKIYTPHEWFHTSRHTHMSQIKW